MASRRQKRPDIQVYVPPGLRNSTSHQKPSSSSCPPEQLNSDEKCSLNDISNSFSKITFDDDCGINLPNEKPKEVIKLPVGASSQLLHPPNLDYDKFQHIIELYDFPSDLETITLETELRPFNDSGFILKWVDDTHCLAVFSSAFTAEQALRSISGILVKVGYFFLFEKWPLLFPF